MLGYGGVLEVLIVAMVLWEVMQYIYKKRSNNSDSHFLQEQSMDNDNALGILEKRFTNSKVSQPDYEQKKKEVM
jgi:uncharacterized membrane protein